MNKITTMLIVLGIITMSFVSTVNVTAEQLIITSPDGQTSHAIINFIGNSGFTAPNGITGGSGTSGDPYIIDNWYIDAGGASYGIYIASTTSHYIIRNCTVFNATISVGLTNSDNGDLFNNTIFGQCLIWGEHNEITYNNIINNGYIKGYKFGNGTIMHNSINNTGHHAIWLDECFYIDVMYNNVTDTGSGDHGVAVESDCRYCFVQYNNITNCDSIGILDNGYATYSEYNYIDNCTAYGIYNGGRYSIVRNNTINNTNIGIENRIVSPYTPTFRFNKITKLPILRYLHISLIDFCFYNLKK